jgi:hypothetical protein
VRQPHDLLSRKKTYRENRLLGLFCPSRAFGRRLDLQKRQPRVIEKDLAGRGERDAARPPLQQLHTDLRLQIANLPAQRGLRGVQPPLGSGQKAAFLSDRNEIA